MSKNSDRDTYENLKDNERRFIKKFIGTNLGILSTISIILYLIFTDIFGITFLVTFSCATIYPLIVIPYYKNKKTFQRKISTEKNFENLDYKKIIFRYLEILKVVTGFRNTFIFFLIITIVILFLDSPELNEDQNVFVEQITLVSLTIIGGVWWTILILKWSFSDRDDFEYYLTRGIFKLITNFPEIDELEKARLTIFGIDSYEDFIKDELKLHFVNKEILYAKIISSNPVGMDSEVRIIMNKLNENKLGLLRYFEKFLFDIDKTSILSRIILTPKIKDYLPLLSIPLAIVIFLTNFFK